jgi:hypothetical protein
MVHSAQTVHVSYTYTHVFPNGPQRDAHDPRHLEVLSGASKTISEPMVYSVQTVHLSWVRLALSPNRLKRASTSALTARSTIGCVQTNFWAYGTFGSNRAPFLHWHQHCLQIDRNEIWHDPRHPRVPSGASKMVSDPMVRSTQTVRLSCTNTNTVSKHTETRFHVTHITYEFLRVCPKLFLSLWYVQCKLCTYLASRLAQSPNRPNELPLEPQYLGVHRVVQNDSWAYGTFGANRAPILHRYLHCLQTDRNEIRHDPHYLGVPSGASKTIPETMVCSVQSVHLSCIKISTISKQNKISFHLSHVT